MTELLHSQTRLNAALSEPSNDQIAAKDMIVNRHNQPAFSKI